MEEDGGDDDDDDDVVAIRSDCCLHTRASLSVHNDSGSSSACLMRPLSFSLSLSRPLSLSLPSHYYNAIVSPIRAAAKLYLDVERGVLFYDSFDC